MLKDPISKGFEILIQDVYEKAKESLKQKLLRIDTYKVIENIANQESDVRFVKTLWQVDKPVDINEFYCDSYVEFQGQRKITVDYEGIKAGDNIVIEGIAGQGKSIFLRYLYLQELRKAKGVPIFIELRRVDAKTSLKKLIYTSLENLGFEIDDTVFKFLVGYTKIVLLLDGYDEVKHENIQELLGEIEELSHIKNIVTIITTRPGTGLEFLPRFHLAKLSNVKGEEYKYIIIKLSDDAVLSKRLIENIEKNIHGIKDLLITPLLITLLIISYKRTQVVPRQLSEFYDDLFDTLLTRHDGVKVGWARPRRCGLDDRQYRRVFEALCLITKQSGDITFTYPSVYECCETALELFGYKENPEKYIKDISKTTCLLLKDGNEMRFIHKSVQEYYAACFIKSYDDATIINLYNSMLNDNVLYLKQELYYLSEIDKFRYVKYFYLPLLCRVFGITTGHIGEDDKNQTLSDTDKIMCILKHFVLNLSFESDGRFYYIMPKTEKRMNPHFEYILLYENLSSYMRMIEDINDIKLDSDSANNACPEFSVIDQSNSISKYSIETLLQKHYLTDDLRQIALGVYNDLYASAIHFKQYLMSEEINIQNRKLLASSIMMIGKI